eukprot:Gb_26098 [translate_table: standard]
MVTDNFFPIKQGRVVKYTMYGYAKQVVEELNEPRPIQPPLLTPWWIPSCISSLLVAIAMVECTTCFLGMYPVVLHLHPSHDPATFVSSFSLPSELRPPGIACPALPGRGALLLPCVLATPL